MALKQILVPLTVVVLLLTVVSLLGILPAQLVSTPEGVYEWDGGYVGEISGTLSMEKSSYNIDQGEAPEFPTMMRITFDSRDLYHDTSDGYLQVYTLAGQISAYTNGVMVYNGYFNDIWDRENEATFTTNTRPFMPNEADSSGVEFSDLTFNDGDTFIVELKTDGIIHGRMWHDDQYGGYYEWDEWSMDWATTIASWEVDIVGDGGDPGPGPEPPPGKANLIGVVTGSDGPLLSGASVELIGVTTVTTDSVGYYEITDIDPGAYGIRITKAGYESYEHTTRLNADETRTLSPTLTKIDDLPPAEDSDGDGLPDTWEMQYFGNLYQTANGDYDNDNYTNIQEFKAGTDPTDPNDAPAFLPFDWNIWVIILLISAFVVAIAIFLMFRGGLMGGILAAISFLVLAVAAWFAGSGLLVSASIISLFMGG